MKREIGSCLIFFFIDEPLIKGKRMNAVHLKEDRHDPKTGARILLRESSSGTCLISLFHFYFIIIKSKIKEKDKRKLIIFK